MRSADEIRGLSERPFKLRNNRVWRTYTGGRLLEQWQGMFAPRDGECPEEWVASTVRASNVGREAIVEGLSLIRLDGIGDVTLKEAIESDPAAFLGRRHSTRYGANPAMLVKVLDAAERLTIQTHPDRAFAQRHFQSPFGKTEAWYVIGGRTIGGEEPYVLLGFKPGVTRAAWRTWFETQHIPGMTDALHRIPVRAGDVFLVEAGVPHAIGPGCFLIEIQEPTDFTFRTERTTPRGAVVPDRACHQGIGFANMLDSFRYESADLAQTLRQWRRTPRLLRSGEGGSERLLIGPEETDRFAMRCLTVRSELDGGSAEHFRIVIVVKGTGSLVWPGGEMAVAQSDRLFVPAYAGRLQWRCEGGEPLEAIVCLPPRPQPE